MPEPIRRAARLIAQADALLIAAGAGMGVDSGLPDFRGPQGFWRAYPPYQTLGLDFADLANPRWFRADPALAWGFYGHRRNLYRATTPHPGFAILRRWAEAKPHGGFVFTSNVDNHFTDAGFDPDRLVEVHGSIEVNQCLDACGAPLAPAGPDEIVVDPTTLRAPGPYPACPTCGGLARPNILMFGDWEWNSARTAAQTERFERWLADLERDGARLAIVECGAGKAVPTVRLTSEALADRLGADLVRLNVRDPEVPRSRHLGLPLPALPALEQLDAALGAAS